jgi:hypothetical protein
VIGRLPWVLFAVTLLCPLLGIAIAGLDPAEDAAVVIVFGAFILAFAGVGALLASRLPANPLGWIMSGAGLVYGLMAFADSWAQAYVRDASEGLPGSLLALWFGNWAWVISVGTTATLLLLLFPTGRLPTPRWRPVAWAAYAGLVLAAIGLAFTPGRIEAYDVDNPVGVAGADAVAGLGMLALAVAAIASVTSLFVRYRSAGFRERQQLKWLLWAAGLVALVIVAIAVTGSTGIGVSDDVTNSAMTGALVAVPVAIGIAILRHGLFDIDVVINRTLVYGALTATLVVAYLAFVLLLQLALSPLTEDNDLAIAGSTLAAAALFRPARARIQALVDRRFYRRKYDAARTIESFGATLRDQVELDSLAGDLRTVVRDTMQPAHMSLWLRAPR